MRASIVGLLAALLLTSPLPLHGQEEDGNQTKQKDRSTFIDFVQVSEDGTSFILEDSGRRFVPWGFNYDHDGPGRLIEDYWPVVIGPSPWASR